MPLDVSELSELMTDLRHSTGDKRTEQLEDVYRALDLAHAAWMLPLVAGVLRQLEWSGETGPMADRMACCPVCGRTARTGHADGCQLARSVGWLG